MKNKKIIFAILIAMFLVTLTGCKNSEKKVSHSVTIPKGATYEVCLDNRGSDYDEALTEGMVMPKIQNHDRYTYGDFVYYYNEYIEGWNVSLPEDENGDDICKEANYGIILSYINGKPVTDMNMTFVGCDNLVDASSIVIPNTILRMTRTFDGCKSLTTAPSIPANVQELYHTFEDCISLTGEIKINANPITVERCFYGTKQSIKLIGSATDETKEKLVQSQPTIYNPTFSTITY